jgi:EpsD family peptidyl-prolyl cis-trans isomerase
MSILLSSINAAQSRKYLVAALTLSAVVLISGCSDSKGNQKIAATVNGAPITEQEIEFSIRQRGSEPASPEAAQQLRRATLADLVRSEMLAQSALASKLDNKDDWEWAQKLARRQYLSTQVYVQAARMAAQTSASEAQKMMAQNAKALEDRKLLTIEELQVSTSAASLLDQLKSATDRGSKLDELEAIAEKSKASTTRGMRQVGSEQVTPEVLTQLLSSKSGHAVWTRPSANLAIILTVRSSVPMPLSGAEAQQYVLDQIRLQARNQEIQSKLQQVSKDAKIEYFGEFLNKSDRQ